MLGRNRWWLPLGALLLTGCPCGRETKTIPFTGGITEDGIYQSSTWNGPWLQFPGGRRYQLAHHLGQAPSSITPYLAFNEFPGPQGDPDKKPGNASLASGNEAVLEQVDAQSILIRNDTCSDFFLLVVAQAGGAGTVESDGAVDAADAAVD